MAGIDDTASFGDLLVSPSNTKLKSDFLKPTVIEEEGVRGDSKGSEVAFAKRKVSHDGDGASNEVNCDVGVGGATIRKDQSICTNSRSVAETCVRPGGTGVPKRPIEPVDESYSSSGAVQSEPGFRDDLEFHVHLESHHERSKVNIPFLSKEIGGVDSLTAGVLKPVAVGTAAELHSGGDLLHLSGHLASIARRVKMLSPIPNSRVASLNGMEGKGPDVVRQELDGGECAQQHSSGDRSEPECMDRQEGWTVRSGENTEPPIKQQASDEATGEPIETQNIIADALSCSSDVEQALYRPDRLGHFYSSLPMKKLNLQMTESDGRTVRVGLTLADGELMVTIGTADAGMARTLASEVNTLGSGLRGSGCKVGHIAIEVMPLLGPPLENNMDRVADPTHFKKKIYGSDNGSKNIVKRPDQRPQKSTLADSLIV